jgi:hypothetical protein
MFFKLFKRIGKPNRVNRSKLCEACLDIRQDGVSIGEFLTEALGESPDNAPDYTDYILKSRIILLRLEQHGGCKRCIRYLKRVLA